MSSHSDRPHSSPPQLSSEVHPSTRSTVDSQMGTVSGVGGMSGMSSMSSVRGGPSTAMHSHSTVSGGKDSGNCEDSCDDPSEEYLFISSFLNHSVYVCLSLSHSPIPIS
jgi:hypothetical protein